MKVINFAPENMFGADILNGRKKQTIRSRPIEVGTKVVLWEKKRGMKKGWYCLECFAPTEKLSETAYLCPEHGEKIKVSKFPRKLLEATIKECIPIEFRWDDEDRVLDLKVKGAYHQSIEYDYQLLSGQCPFVKADTPDWNNRQFIDFFLRTYPKIRKKWVKFYIWKWQKEAEKHEM